MTKKTVRYFNIFTILIVLISQVGLLSLPTLDVAAAPAQDTIPLRPSFAGVTISNVHINRGGNSSFIAPGSTFSLSLDYSITDAPCPGCIDEIEIGFSTASAPFTCIYTGIPGAVGTSGSATIQVTAPAAPGIYYLGFDRAQHFSCDQALASGWWNGAPDSSRYVASVIAATQVVNSAADTDDGFCNVDGCTLREAINAANVNEGLDVVAFNIPGEGVQTISPLSALPAITDPIIIDGYTQAGASSNTLAVGDNANLQIELNGDSCSSASCSQALLLSSGGSTIRGLAIHGNFNNGIEVNGSGSVIAGNFFGLKADGSAHGVAASGIYVNNTTNNTIGGYAPADRNVISNNRDGIFIAAGGADATNNVIAGNYIGTDPTGTFAQGNRQRGIFVGSFGFTVSGTSINNNLISGNGHFGVLLRDGNVTGSFVTRNIIGMDASGTEALPNGNSESFDDGLAGTNARAGIYIAGSNNSIGDAESGGNAIAFNTGAGITLAFGSGNRILGNNIFSNTGPGIDLGGNNVTFNHQGVIDGPNNYQNYPVLTVATSDAEFTRVGGFLDSDPNQNYRIDVFANDACDSSFFGEGQTYFSSFSVTTDSHGRAVFDRLFGVGGIVEPHGITVTATGANGTSEFSYCRPISSSNSNWADAQLVESGSHTQQYMTDIYQEKWFKFPVQPGSSVSIKLTSLPGSAVSLHTDPHLIYDQLTNPENAPALSALSADPAFLPSGSLPSGSLPSGSLPSGSLPSGSLPSGSLPTGYLPSGSLPSGSLPSGSLPSGSLPSGSLPSGSLPSGSLPSGSLPSGSLPSGSLPSGSLPSGSLPSGSLPSGSLPSGSLPSGSLPSGSLPSGSLPSGSLPSGSLDAFAMAARQSLLGISMDPYATVQTIERNTYDLQEDLYVRVVGPYDLNTPFTLDVTVTGGICSAVQPISNTLSVISGPQPASGSQTSLILTDSSRLHGTSAEITQALSDLQTLANRNDVNGLVIDLADAKYQRVAAANTQADSNLGCPSAKNTVATEIKKVIDAYRAANPTLQYIVLAGGADVIPFFQVPDVAGLANEKDYIPPVKPSTASEAGLATNLVQGQDAYGSKLNITQYGYTLALPDLAVGRLVDNASDISAAINSYIQTNGVIVPHSSLVTGYDFVGDAAAAIKTEMDAGTNSTADTLIEAPGLPPTDPTAWTANQLRTKLLAGNFDIAVLSGHFSAGNLLAADYATQLSASEIAQSAADLNHVLVLTLGCHGGYSIPNSDLFGGISPDPDWAKTFLRKGAAGYIAATGYAYGDTELTEYGERLFVLMSQQLRTGNGPVSIGQAVVKAKQQYLAQTAQLTGIDQKTLIEMTLYGLPMMKVDMPGARLNAQSDASIVGTTDPVLTGPGAGFSLSSSSVSLNPSLTTNNKQLPNLADNSTVNTTYLSGADGVVVNPFEPIYPKQIDNITASDSVLRGVAFRGGSYTDLNGIIPLTSSPTTETSTAHLSYNTDVFYPPQVWTPNYSDAISGGATRLITFPAQFKSSAPGAIDGTLRKFSQLDLQLYYLPSSWANAGSPATKAAAVSAAPNILGASGAQNGNQINFSVNALAEGSAGVQAIWILYTGKSGDAHYGTWTPLDLIHDPNDPARWVGSLPLQSGENASDILFMVQAVGGAGLTTLATNLGAYYGIGAENANQLPPPAPTTLDLQSPPASGTYLKNSSFNLVLQSNGQPLAGQLVSLDIGGQQASGITDATGKATLTLKLVVRPGSYTAQASFRGNSTYLSSNDTSAFTVNKDSTTLTVTPTTASVPANQPTPFVAVVRDSVGRALGGKSVFFVIHNATNTFATSVIADFQGNAVLGTVPLPAGVYTVDAYFNGTIPLNPSITLTDDYYENSSKLGLSLTIVSDTTPPTLNPIVSPNPVYLNGTATVTANATDSGSGIATQSCGPLFTNTVGTKTVTCTATDNAGNTATATVSYKVIYRFDGFLQPINDTGHTQTCGSSCTTSIFKGGSTVPVKFQLKDANGNVVQSVSLPTWITPQKGSATSSPVDESLYSDPATTGTNYRWDGSSQYIYNWSTKGFTSGYYWRIGVTLDDGQTYYVNIGLR